MKAINRISLLAAMVVWAVTCSAALGYDYEDVYLGEGMVIDKNSISGTVDDKYGDPVPGVTMTMYDAEILSFSEVVIYHDYLTPVWMGGSFYASPHVLLEYNVAQHGSITDVTVGSYFDPYDSVAYISVLQPDGTYVPLDCCYEPYHFNDTYYESGEGEWDLWHLYPYYNYPIGKDPYGKWTLVITNEDHYTTVGIPEVYFGGARLNIDYQRYEVSTTDEHGRYQFITNVQDGHHYRILPKKEGFEFFPEEVPDVKYKDNYQQDQNWYSTTVVNCNFAAEPAAAREREVLFETQPSDTMLGKPITPPVKVVVVENGAAPANPVTVSLHRVAREDMPDVALRGTVQATTDADGVATFDNVWLNGIAGSYQIYARASSGESAVSNIFSVVQGHLEVVSPNGGETLKQYEEAVVRWAGFKEETDQVKVELSLDGGNTWKAPKWHIELDNPGDFYTADDGEVRFILEDITDHGRIRITSQTLNEEGLLEQDTSDADFVIEPPRPSGSYPVLAFSKQPERSMLGTIQDVGVTVYNNRGSLFSGNDNEPLEVTVELVSQNGATLSGTLEKKWPEDYVTTHDNVSYLPFDDLAIDRGGEYFFHAYTMYGHLRETYSEPFHYLPDSNAQVVGPLDQTPPGIVPYYRVTAEQENAGGTAVDLEVPDVVDDQDVDLVVTHDAPDLFPLGDTLVTWTATDNSGNVATAYQMVTIVDTTPPELTVPGNVAMERTASGDAPVDLGDATATDICDADVSITNDAPTVFPLGDTLVTWTATDDSGNAATATQKVTVLDATPPVLTVPADVTAEQANRDGTPVNLGEATATDNLDDEVDIANDALAVFPLGETIVTWTATDDSGNVATGTQKVTVKDTMPPVLTVPGDVTAEQTNRDGTPVEPGNATATDICDADVAITNDAPAVFPLGVTVVIWTATDNSGNATTGTQKVTVVDTAPPQVSAPADVTMEQTSKDGTAVALGEASATDICDADPSILNDAPQVFPLGTSTVTWTATDNSGNVSTALQKVTVEDTMPPSLEASVNKETLWPANHKYVKISISIAASDICDADVEKNVQLVSVTSDEPEDLKGNGDGSTKKDIVIVNRKTVKLRAEREGTSDGRVYTLNYTVTDASGNTTEAPVTVSVPHSRKDKAVDSGVAYTVTP